MSDTHNGWTNYETWRIKLELFDDPSMFEDEVTADQLEEQADDAITNYGELEGLAVDYARSFMSEVNWHEIANSINEDLKEVIK